MLAGAVPIDLLFHYHTAMKIVNKLSKNLQRNIVFGFFPVTKFLVLLVDQEVLTGCNIYFQALKYNQGNRKFPFQNSRLYDC